MKTVAEKYTLNDAKNDGMVMGKYKRHSNKFESGQFEFDLDTCEAFSYNWWQFVIKVGNTIYFNNASYSMQTSLHQDMAKNILFWEGVGTRIRYGSNDGATVVFPNIKVKYVYYREGLNHLDTAISNMISEIGSLRELISNPRSQKKANKHRVQSISQIQKKIKQTKKLQRILAKQFRLNAAIKDKKEQIKNERELKLSDQRWERMRKEQERSNALYLVKDEGIGA